MRYTHRPYRYVVTVDGREIGEPYRTPAQAKTLAESLQTVAPWSIIEVIGVLK